MRWIRLTWTILILALVCTATSSAEPTTVSGWNEEGLDLYSQGKYDEAIQAYGNALNLNQNDEVTWRNLAAAYEAKGDYDHAIQCLDKVRNIVPSEEQEALRAKVSELANRVSGQTSEMETELNQNPSSILESPQTATDWLNEGQRLVDQGKYEEALHAYDNGIQLSPQWTDLYYHKGTAYSKLDRVDEAVQAFYTVVEINPKDGVVAYYWIGRVLAGAGRYDEAIQAFEKSTQSFETYGEWYPGQKHICAQAWYNEGLALDTVGRSDEAQNAYLNAKNLDPSLARPGTGCDATVKKMCPWSPADFNIEPCCPGYCWDGGPQGTLKCVPERIIASTGAGTTAKDQAGDAYPQTMTVFHKHELLWPTTLEKTSEKDCIGYYKGTNFQGKEATATFQSSSSGEAEIYINIKEDGYAGSYIGKPKGTVLEGEYDPMLGAAGFGLPDYFKAEMSSPIGECHVEIP
jgi:tetratricopeptide (TPR) repeat protein